MYETVYRDLYHYALCLMKNPQEAERGGCCGIREHT